MPHQDITVLCGDGDVGKTTIAVGKTARWTRGQCEGIFKNVPVDVLIASAEGLIRPYPCPTSQGRRGRPHQSALY